MQHRPIPHLNNVLNQKLLNWAAVLFIISAVTFGSIFYTTALHDIEKHSEVISTSLARYVESYVENAMNSLHHVGLEIEFDSTPQSTLQRAWLATQLFSRIMLVAPDRTILASAPTGLTKIDFPIPLTPIKDKDHRIGPPVALDNELGMVVHLSHSLSNGYMLVGALKLDAIQSNIASIQPAKGERVVLTDAWGAIIAHPEKQNMVQQKNIGFLPFYTKGTDLEETQTITLDNVSYIASANKVPALDWILITMTPALNVYRDVMLSVAQFLLFLLLLYSIFSISFALEIKNALLKPFSNLSESMKQLAGGSYAFSNSTDSFAELASLRETFNTMAETIQTREEELAQAQTYLKSIMNSMPSTIIGVDTTMRITHLNTAAEEWGGYTENEAKGRDLIHVFPSLQSLSDSILAAQDRQCPINIEKRPVPGDDSLTFQDILLYPLTDNGVQGVVLRVDDVTRRVRMEEMMVQAEKMMSVGGLAAGMAHEINNPLGAILQGAQNIERRLSTELQANMDVAERVGCSLEKIREYLIERHILVFLDGIREAGTRAAHIVSNMLNFSRASESRHSTIDIHTSLNRTIELANNDYDLKKQYDFREILIVRDFDPCLQSIIGSSNEIEQVVLNLLRNAAQAVQAQKENMHGGPCITIRTRQERGFVRIEVEDNGPGMQESVRKRIFEPFFTTKEIGVGTGLGLSVSYFIITENHRGTFDVVSSPGAGARFIIRLPASPDYKTPSITAGLS